MPLCLSDYPMFRCVLTSTFNDKKQCKHREGSLVHPTGTVLPDIDCTAPDLGRISLSQCEKINSCGGSHQFVLFCYGSQNWIWHQLCYKYLDFFLLQFVALSCIKLLQQNLGPEPFWVCVYMFLYVHACTCVHVETRDWCWCLFLNPCLLYF